MDHDTTMHGDGDAIHLPPSTPWPLVLALGMALLPAGLVTWPPASAIGAVLVVVGVLMLVREDLER